jgi:oxalate decarboxylase
MDVLSEVLRVVKHEDISLAEWLAHTPSRPVEQHLEVSEEFLAKIARKQMAITPE